MITENQLFGAAETGCLLQRLYKKYIELYPIFCTVISCLILETICIHMHLV